MVDGSDRPSPRVEFEEAIRALAEASLTHPTLKTADRLAWAVEEALHRGTDEREYLVPAADDDLWWISIGWGSVVAELTYAVDPATADGVAALNSEVDDRSMDRYSRVLRVGPAPADPSGAYPAMGDGEVAAVSVERLGELLSAAFTSARPGIELLHDRAWEHHRHPLAHLRPSSEG